MDDTSTPKILKHSFKNKDMFYKKNVWYDIDKSFEARLKILIDKDLLNPRIQVIDEILSFSKKIL